LIEAFVSAGHDIDLVLMAEKGELLSLLPSSVRRFDLRAVRIRSVVRPLARYFRERRPDALQASMWPLTVAAVVARRVSRSNSRLVVSDHAILSEQYQTAATCSALRLSTRWFYPLADARVVVSRGAAEDLARLSGLAPRLFDVIYNPIPEPRLRNLRQPEVEKLWGDAEVRVLNVGSLKPEKNQALLLRAFSHLRRRRLAKLIVLGEGACRPALEALTSELGIETDVLMPGFAADPWPYYASADLFVLSSDYEGFGNVLVEAMRCGVPVVSTDCPCGPREILADGRYGRLVPVGDEVMLANAIMEAVESAAETADLKARAETLSGRHSARRYLELLVPELHPVPLAK
jgi:glycosyltransferase involved in cell wall biosynthesis